MRSSRQGSTRSISTGRRILFSIVVVAIALLLLEGAASFLLATRRALTNNVSLREQAHCRYDADLGWSNIPHLRVADLYGPGKSFSTNAAGFRGTTDYTPGIPAGKYRLQFLGDSFTMGFGVDDRDPFCARLESGTSGLEVLNMGLGGYGLDQMYLAYLRDGVKYRTDALVVAVIAPDFDRMTSDRFMGVPKPRLVAENGKLVTRNVPVPRAWGGGAERRRRIQTFTESLTLGHIMNRVIASVDSRRRSAPADPVPCSDVASLILSALQDRCRERGQAFVVVYLPIRLLIDQEPTPVASWLAEFCRSHGVHFIDLTDDLGRLPPWELIRCFDPGGHYSARGHERIAAALAARFPEFLPGYPRPVEAGGGAAKP